MENSKTKQISKAQTEYQLLGMIMTEPFAIDKVIDSDPSRSITDADFTTREAKAIWKAIEKLHSRSEPVGLGQLIDQLKADETLNDAGGVDFILKIADSGVSVICISDYVRILKEASLRRSLSESVRTVQELTQKEDVPVPQVISSIQDIAEKTEKAYFNGAGGSEKITTMVEYARTQLNSDLRGFSGLKPKTNFEYLDRILGDSLYPGTYTLAATSSLGKTTFAAQLADQVAEQHVPVLYVSVEMSALDILSKSLARIVAKQPGNINTTALRIKKYWNANGDKSHLVIPETEFDAITAAFNIYKEKIAPYMTVTGLNFECQLSDILSCVSGFCRRNTVKPLVVIDYLQIIKKAKDFHGTDQQHIDICMSEIERLAKKEQIPIFVISSVNRASYLTPISFESLKTSGSIEFSSDVVIAIDLCAVNEIDNIKTDSEKREVLNQARQASPRRIRMRLLKNRFGTNAETFFYYYPAQERFQSLEKAPPKNEIQSVTNWI